MRFLAGIGGFFLGLIFGAPFFGALVMGAAAFGVTHLIRKANQEPEQPEAPARTPSRDEEEFAPDGSDPDTLRAYLRHQNQRIRTLENELKALRAVSQPGPADSAPLVQAAESAPAAMQPAVEAPAAPAPVAPEISAALEEVARVAESLPVQAPPTEPPPYVEVVPPSIPQLEPAPAAIIAPEPAAPEPIAIVLQEPKAAPAAAYEAAAAQPPSGPPPRIEQPPQAEAPRGPSLISRLLSGNLVAKVGAIVLFIGVGFLLRLAYDRGMMPIELRIVGVAVAAAVIFALGWRLRGRRRLYALILQGVASGLAYLDVYFTLRFEVFDFFGPAAGFSLFALIGVVTTVLAVRQDAKPLALYGLIGAFMSPILASSGSGNYVVLFSYYLLLNLFVLAISWFRAWRALNLMGWFFTFGVATFWGLRSYGPSMFTTVEPFLLAFFAIYLVIPILFATRQPPELRGLVDGSLVFGTPAAVAVMQARLVWGMPYGLAWSAALGAGLYAVLSVMALRHKNMRLLGQTYVALAVGLGTLAIFFAFGAYTTFALWSIEGAAILWVCLRQNQLLGRVFAVLVQLAGAIYFFLDYNDYSRVNPFFNDAVLGCAIIAGASFLSASLLRRYRETIAEGERILTQLLLVWGALWWSLGGIDLIHNGFAPALKPAALVLFLSASALGAEWIGARTTWPMLRGLSAVHLIALVVAASLQWSVSERPLADLGWLAWPAGLASFYWVLHRQRADNFDALGETRYYLGWALLGVLATWEAAWWVDKHQYLYVMVLALGGYLAAGLRHRLRELDTAEVRFSWLPVLWATAFWYGGGVLWVRELLPVAQEPAAVIAFATASVLVAEVVGRMMRWPALRASGGVQVLLLLAAAAAQLSSRTHPFGDYGWLAWPFGLGGLFWILHRQKLDGPGVTWGWRYVAAWLILGVIATWEALWWIDKREYLYTMLLALLGYAAAGARFWLYERDSKNAALSTIPMLWATVFWYLAGVLWLINALPDEQIPAAAIGFVTASALTLELLGAAARWGGLRASAGVHPVLLAGGIVIQVSTLTHPMAHYGWLAWPAALGGLFWTLHRQRRDGFDALRSQRYSVAWLLLLLVATCEALWWLDKKEYAYAMGIALGGYLAAGLRHRLSDVRSGELWPGALALVWSMLFWFAGAFLWIHDRLPHVEVQAALLVVALSALAYELASRPLAWPALRMAARLPWLALPAAILMELGSAGSGHPFSGWASVAWVASWAIALHGLRREETEGQQLLNGTRHGIALYAPVVLVTWELAWRFVDWRFGDAWRTAGLAVPAVLAIGIVVAARSSVRWPFRDHGQLYLGMAGPLVLLLMLWSLALNIRAPGSLAPLASYIPLLNPIDAILGASGLAAFSWYRTLEDEGRRGAMRRICALLGFVWLNAIALRSIHYWDGVPYEIGALARSVLVQAALSILWTATALGMMLLARRSMDRQPWIVGAALLAVVVGKLFLVDLANTGTVARIVSFVGVGVMLLVIGYVAPVPPGAKEAESDA